MANDAQPIATPLPRPARIWRRVAIVVAALGLVAAGWNWYWVHVRHRLGTVSEGQVYKSGAMPPAQMAAVAKSLKLRVVIDLRTSIEGQDSTNTTPMRDIDAERAALAAIGVKHFHLPSAQVPTDATVDRFLEVVADPANRPFLIHCYHGTGRTELFAALWRIEFEGWTNDAARRATRFIVAGTSFGVTAEKGRYLMEYRLRRAVAAPR
jgi:protein tyrosine/serine phosphatase